MRDLIVRIFGRLSLALIPTPDPRATLTRCAELLFPARGRHRAPEKPPTRQASTVLALPARMSPYAQAVANWVPLTETASPVRPFVLVDRRERLSPEEAAQAERRWALDMAARGIDVGPHRIHGVQMLPRARTVPVAVA